MDKLFPAIFIGICVITYLSPVIIIILLAVWYRKWLDRKEK